MEQNDPSPARQISRIETSHVERLHAGQVIVDLSSIVKELLENALDAGATSIVIDLEQYGREVVVSDNGSGIAPSDFASLARKHHTSKLATFDDLDSVSSFGFRGEALAALANVCHLVVSTRRLCDGNGARLEFDVSGEVTSNSPVSHPVGTTVSVTEVFRNLPVRQEEYVKNLKREYAKLLPLIQSYMLICNNVKISLFNTALKRQLVFASSGKSDMRENAVLAFGSKEAKGLEYVEAMFESLDVKMEGLVTSLNSGLGRRAKDRHFFFLNKRPVDLPSFGKVMTECFRVTSANQGKFPTVILNFTIKSEHVDLNVTPEKRTVFVAIEGKLLDALRGFLTQHFSQNAAVPLVFNEASQTATIPQRFPPALVLRNKSAPTPVAVSSVSQSLSSSSSSSSSATPKLFEAFGFKRHASAPALWPPAASLPVAPAKQEVAECRHHDHHNHDVGWDELVIVDEERDVDIEIVDEAKQGQRSVSNAMAVAVDADEGPKQNKNVFAEMFGFGSLKRPRVEVEPVVSLIPPASDAIEMPVMLQDAKRGKIELNDNVEMEDRVVPLSQDVPVSPLEHQDERADERDVRTSYSFSPLSASSSSSSSVLEFDLDAVRWAVKRRRDALVEGSQRAKSEMPAMFKKEYFNRLQVVGQFNNGFIITRFDDTSDLFIVDQHASNEIFNFETLQKSTVLRVQRLLVPIPIDFSPAEEIDVVSNMNVFERNGFLLECDENSMPGKKIKLVGRPESKDTTFGEADVRELAELVRQSSSNAVVRPSRVRAMFASRACRMSVMIGDSLNREQMQKIVGDLAGLDAPWTCPHGRPTFKHLYKIEDNE